MSDHGEDRDCLMNPGEAVYQVIRVKGPFGCIDGTLDMLMDLLDSIRASCPTAEHRPPHMTKEQVERAVIALAATGCIVMEGTRGGTWKDAPKPLWTDTYSEVVEQRVAIARSIDFGGNQSTKEKNSE